MTSAVKAYDQVDLGRIVSAGFAKEPPAFVGTDRVRGVRRAGQIYEWKVQEHFATLLEESYVRSPWLLFRSTSRPNWQYCQPDGLIFDWSRRSIIVVEVKLRHTPDAYWQVNNLYQPVLEKVFDGRSWHFRRLEVVKWYDPSTYFPDETVLVDDPLLTPRNKMGVHIWKK